SRPRCWPTPGVASRKYRNGNNTRVVFGGQRQKGSRTPKRRRLEFSSVSRDLKKCQVSELDYDCRKKIKRSGKNECLGELLTDSDPDRIVHPCCGVLFSRRVRVICYRGWRARLVPSICRAYLSPHRFCRLVGDRRSGALWRGPWRLPIGHHIRNPGLH